MSRDKPQDEPQPAAKERADYLAESQEDPFETSPKPIVVLQHGALVGQVALDAGVRLAEVRLAKGVTLDQLCAAIRLGQAGPKPR